MTEVAGQRTDQLITHILPTNRLFVINLHVWYVSKYLPEEGVLVLLCSG